MPWESITLGPKYAIRLSDLTAADALEVECFGCGHRFLVGPHRLHERYASYFRLKEICEDMRCPKCRKRDPMWRVLRARPDPR